MLRPEVIEAMRDASQVYVNIDEYVQQGSQQGGYFDEIAVDPSNLQPGDEEIIAQRLRQELMRR